MGLTACKITSLPFLQRNRYNPRLVNPLHFPAVLPKLMRVPLVSHPQPMPRRKQRLEIRSPFQFRTATSVHTLADVSCQQPGTEGEISLVECQGKI
jgi:hypothetical protein